MIMSDEFERTQEACDLRAAEYAVLEQAIESTIGQVRHYGIRVWQEDVAGSFRHWFVTDPHRNVERFAFAWYRDTPPPVDVYTREQYEAACAAVGVTPAADDELGTYADRFMPPTLWDMPAVSNAATVLRLRRMAGVVHETPPVPPVVEQVRELASTGVADRQATRVANLLGLPEPRATGNCHYCGLPLDARGECEECSR
jgi:hypothetical protein